MSKPIHRTIYAFQSASWVGKEYKIIYNKPASNAHAIGSSCGAHYYTHPSVLPMFNLLESIAVIPGKHSLPKIDREYCNVEHVKTHVGSLTVVTVHKPWWEDGTYKVVYNSECVNTPYYDKVPDNVVDYVGCSSAYIFNMRYDSYSRKYKIEGIHNEHRFNKNHVYVVALADNRQEDVINNLKSHPKFEVLWISKPSLNGVHREYKVPYLRLYLFKYLG